MPTAERLRSLAPGTWADRSACRRLADDPNSPVTAALWDEPNGPDAADAYRICSHCPVLVECQTWALVTRQLDHGILGALAPDDRRRYADGLNRKLGRGA